ncbi:MAG: hypothetical protein J6V44_08015 [Methanobrevibacter sp.]|nr:hypothetical protein [Methanobrevibacter sp.]
MANFLKDKLVHTFHDNSGNFSEVNTTIKELFEADLSSSADGRGADFEALSLVVTKLKYFINTSKANTSDELLSTATAISLTTEDRLVALLEGLSLGKLHVSLLNLLRKDFIDSLFNQRENQILVLTI